METLSSQSGVEHPGPCLPSPPLSTLQSLKARALTVLHLRGIGIHVPNYVWCALFTAIAGFIFGFDTGSIGPITIMPQFQSAFFGKGTITPIIQGLIVSSILLTASIASLFSGPLSDRISRTRTIALGAIIFAAGSAIACSARSLAQLLVGRCIAGIGEGFFMSAVTVYALEIAPTSTRGRLGSVVQLFITIGIALGYFVCYGTSRIPSSLSWRFPLGMQAVIAAILAAGCPVLPHSPRWLRHVGRDAEADATWIKLGVAATDAEKTEELTQRESPQRGGWWKESQQLWKKGVKGRTGLGVFLMGMAQLSGIDAVLYYAPVIFSQAGLDGTTSSLIASGVSGVINVVCTFGIQFFADSWGRRPTMILGGSVLAGTMLIMGTLYASHASDTPAGRWSIIVLIYIFVVGYTSTWAIVIRIIASEIQPMRTRAAATSLGQWANWVVNWVIAFSTPFFLARTASGPYFLFGTCSLVTTLVCVAFQPETRGASLEDVDKAFEIAPWKVALTQHRLAHRRQRRERHSPTTTTSETFVLETVQTLEQAIEKPIESEA